MRKEAYVTLGPEAGRDDGRMYKIVEMPASQGEAFGERLLFALARGGVDVPPNLFGSGMEVLALIAIRALSGARWEDAKPLLDEMMGCIFRVPDPNRPELFHPLVETDIEEIATRLRLRDEVIELHTGFSVRAKWSDWTSREPEGQTQTDGSPPGSVNLPNTPMSGRA